MEQMERMKLNTKLVILVVALATALGLLGKVAWDRRELGLANSALNEQLMQSKLEIGRAETKFGDADRYVGELEGALRDEIDERNALMTRYGELELSYRVAEKNRGKAETIYVEGEQVEIPAECPKFVRGLLYEAITENVLAPLSQLIGEHNDFRISLACMFRPQPNYGREIPFFYSYQIHLKFVGQLVETITPSGAVNNYFNLWEVDEKGKKGKKLKIDKFSVVVKDQRAPEFFWWAPHLDVGVLLGLNQRAKFTPGGSLGVSFMGYGLTKNDLSWRFLRLSMDLSDKPGGGLDIVQYNLGQLMPLISNLWVGPHLMMTFDREYTLGFVIGAVL